MSKSRTIILSLDFDGCADILFGPLFVKYKQSREIIASLKVQREKFNRFLTEKSKESKSGVELYVGSNRQSHELDKSVGAKGSGLCLELFPKLAAERGWKFIPVLDADVQEGKDLGVGTAFKDATLRCTLDKLKIHTIMHQLQHVAKHHPNPDDEVHYYFCDDDPSNEILLALKQHLERAKIDIPQNIRIYLVKFDWFSEIVEDVESLKEFAMIDGAKKFASESTASVSAVGMFGGQAEAVLNTATSLLASFDGLVNISR